MNLTIDIGNSTAKLAAFEHGELVDYAVVCRTTLEGLELFIARHDFTKAILSTVVELSDKAKTRLSLLPFPLHRLGTGMRLPIQNNYRTPETLGQDRIAAVVGAAYLYPNKDLLLIDAGTCITYDFVTAKGEYNGGNISPGLEMRLNALHHFTSKLPKISKEGDVPSMGYSTETAIRAGVIRGIRFEMMGYIEQFSKSSPLFTTLLTGGDQFDLDNNIKNLIFADKFIVPKGLNRILEYNEHI